MISFTGQLHPPGSAGFEEAVVGRVFNARRPAAVLEAASEWDLGDSDFTSRRLKILGDTQERRLEQIRADRDPTGLFVGHLYTR